MKYQHHFRLQVPIAKVATFHARSESMTAITPPPILVQVHHAPAILSNGDDMSFTLWLGPLPIHWLARIENITPNGFVDRQIEGPFESWAHHHRFLEIDDSTTEVVDEIEARLSPHPFWKFIGWNMWLGLPVLFAFRAWKTKCLLERTPNNGF